MMPLTLTFHVYFLKFYQSESGTIITLFLETEHYKGANSEGLLCIEETSFFPKLSISGSLPCGPLLPKLIPK